MNGETPALSSVIAAHVAGAEFYRLPASTVAATKRAILDGIGVMLAASGESTDILPFVDIARRYAGVSEATILGFGERVGAPMAALANGAMAHALDFEDAFDAVPTHPNASLLPAVLSIIEAHGPIDGRDVIAAVATGCDLVCRIALSLRQPMEIGGWYPPPMLGAFGATAAAARLLRLTPAQVTDAFSLLLCQNTCPGEIKYSPDTVIRAVREAFPAQAAVLSSLLAQRGVRGFDFPFEGRSGFYQLYAEGKYDAATVLDRFGVHYWIEQLSFKKWPCCRGTHAFIEAAQVLRRQHEFRGADIAEIRIAGGEVLRMLCEPHTQKREPQTVIDGKFSLPFVVASALTLDEITLGSFTPHALRDPALLALTAKSVFELSAEKELLHAAAGELTLRLRDGRELRHRVLHALGDPQRPLEDDALNAKFLDCASRAAAPFSREAAGRLAARIWNLENERDAGAALSGR